MKVDTWEHVFILKCAFVSGLASVEDAFPPSAKLLAREI
jgi:hypothetical protein